MADAVFVAVVVAFFAIAVASVKGCERIIGSGDVVRVVEQPDEGADAWHEGVA